MLAFAGTAWFGWAQAEPPPSWVPYLVAGSLVSAVLLVALILLLVRHRTTTGSPMADPAVRRGYWVTVAVEVVAVVAVAAAFLGLTSDLAPSAASGAGGGIVFIGYAVWVLTRGRLPAQTPQIHTQAPGTAPRGDDTEDGPEDRT